MNSPETSSFAGEQGVTGRAILGAARLAERNPAAEFRQPAGGGSRYSDTSGIWNNAVRAAASENVLHLAQTYTVAREDRQRSTVAGSTGLRAPQRMNRGREAGNKTVMRLSPGSKWCKGAKGLQPLASARRLFLWLTHMSPRYIHMGRP